MPHPVTYRLAGRGETFWRFACTIVKENFFITAGGMGFGGNKKNGSLRFVHNSPEPDCVAEEAQPLREHRGDVPR